MYNVKEDIQKSRNDLLNKAIVSSNDAIKRALQEYKTTVDVMLKDMILCRIESLLKQDE